MSYTIVRELERVGRKLTDIFNLLQKQSQPQNPFDKAELEKNGGFARIAPGVIAQIITVDDKFVQMHVFDFNMQLVTTSTDYGHTAAATVNKFTDMPQKAMMAARRAAEALGA